MIVLAVDIRGVPYYEILVEMKAINVARYLEFVKTLMGRWQSYRKHTVLLFYNNSRPHRHTSVTSWMEQTSI